MQSKIELIEYAADQIRAHIEYLKSAGEYQGNESLKYIHANYPSRVKKPCDMRIYYAPKYPGVFFLKWQNKEPEDKLTQEELENLVQDWEEGGGEGLVEFVRKESKKSAHIAIYVVGLNKDNLGPSKPTTIFRVNKRWLRRLSNEGRKGWAKTRKDYESEARSLYKNLVAVSKNTSHEELCLQIGIYLLRDDILNSDAKGEVYLFFQNYVKEHFPKFYKTLKDYEEELNIYKRIITNFKLPPDEYAFSHYMWVSLWGAKQKMDAKTKLPGGGLTNWEYLKQRVPSSTYYYWIRSKKLPLKKKQGRYRETTEAEEILTGLLQKRQKERENISIEREKREAKKIFRRCVKLLAEKRKVEPKSVMRELQRKGIKGIEERIKYLIDNKGLSKNAFLG